MVLQEIGGGGYDYAQSSTPSGAEIGEAWLDTSVSPPQSKVYEGSSWVSVDALQKILNNVDSKISNAGASQTDIQNAILSDGTTFDGSNIDAAISEAGSSTLGDVAGTTKAAGRQYPIRIEFGLSGGSYTDIERTACSVSGSGYAILGRIEKIYTLADNEYSNITATVRIVVDGNEIPLYSTNSASYETYTQNPNASNSTDPVAANTVPSVIKFDNEFKYSLYLSEVDVSSGITDIEAQFLGDGGVGVYLT